MIDGPQNGTAPGPWDIQASPPSLFQDYTQCFEVPHTASVKVSAVKLGFSLYQLTNFSPTFQDLLNWREWIIPSSLTHIVSPILRVVRFKTLE